MILTCIFFHCSMCISMHLHLQVETEILKGVAGLLLLSALNSYLTPHFLVANLGDISVFRYLSWIHHAISQDNAELQSTFWAVPVSGFDQIQSHVPARCSRNVPKRDMNSMTSALRSPAIWKGPDMSRCSGWGAKTPVDFHGVWTFLVRFT